MNRNEFRRSQYMSNRHVNRLIVLVKSDLTSGDAPGLEDGHTYSKLEFHKESKALLRAIAKQMSLLNGTYDIRSNLAGPAVSGEITLHGENIYIQFSQTALGPDFGFMYRKCDGRKDYRGHQNHWMKWEDLLDLDKACSQFAAVAERG